jgi:hypothetical protein
MTRKDDESAARYSACPDDFDRAWQDVCAWRGRCINIFASIEGAVIDLLKTLMPEAKTKRLAGQRSSDLKKVQPDKSADQPN